MPGGHRPGPTEAAAETCPLEKLYIILKIEIPLPCQRGPLFQKSIGAGGGERAPVALCREPTEAAAETGVGIFWKEIPSAAFGGTSLAEGGKPRFQ